MKNLTGKIIGFIIGSAGFLYLFKIIILDRTSPSDELAPGIVVFIAIISGLVCAYTGNLIQNSLEKRGK
jgi:hypothetical protein